MAPKHEPQMRKDAVLTFGPELSQMMSYAGQDMIIHGQSGTGKTVLAYTASTLLNYAQGVECTSLKQKNPYFSLTYSDDESDEGTLEAVSYDVDTILAPFNIELPKVIILDEITFQSADQLSIYIGVISRFYTARSQNPPNYIFVIQKSSDSPHQNVIENVDSDTVRAQLEAAKKVALTTSYPIDPNINRLGYSAVAQDTDRLSANLGSQFTQLVDTARQQLTPTPA